MNKEIELLAPVGSMDALKAGILNGANAVYLGGKNFNARQYASNFTDDELLEAVSYAHLRGVRVYVTLNILIDEGELSSGLDYVRYLRKIGVDAIIVQDIGFASIIREVFKDLEVHASTQMTINNLYGVKHLEKLGFKRVVLAREVPLSEIKTISAKTNMELEVFVHGALCFSYSGQCLMSSFIGGRSGNRGTCAQPCRMPYRLLDENGKLSLENDKAYLLSTRDLNTIEEINELVKANVKSFKVEGRMKRPEYVATVISAYRKALDFGVDSIKETEKKDMETIFNRGFTRGLSLGDFGRDFVNVDRPDNRGRVIGYLFQNKKNEILIKFNEDLSAGDGIEWDKLDGGYDGMKLNRDYSSLESHRFENIKNPLINSQVRLTSSAKLLSKANETYSKDKSIFPVDMKVEVKIGQKLKLYLYYKDIVITKESEDLVERANKSGTDKERIKEQVSKLGDTIFYSNSIEINLEENSFIPIKALNKLRRDAIRDLESEIISKNKKEDIKDTDFYKMKKDLLKSPKLEKTKTILSVKINKKDHLIDLNLDKLDRLYLPFDLYNKENLDILRKKDIEIYLWTDNILYEKDIEEIKSKIRKEDLDGISVSNIGSFEAFLDEYKGKIHADFGLNIFNSKTAKYFLDRGASSYSLSRELNISQISKISEKIGGQIESLLYGYVPLMITKNCPMAYIKNCKDDRACLTCKYKSGYSLQDKMGKNFKMERKNAYTNIYNSVPLMGIEAIPRLKKLGLTNFRLDFTLEKDIRQIQSLYYDYLHGIINDKDVLVFMDEYKKTQEITKGHFFRGVL